MQCPTAIFLFISFLMPLALYSQSVPDSMASSAGDRTPQPQCAAGCIPSDSAVAGAPNHIMQNPYKFKPLQLIIPATMIGVGIVGLESHWIINRNHEIGNELQESGHKKFTLDDFSQFMPAAAVYGLRLCGVKGLHDFRGQTILLGTSALLMGAAVTVIKSTSNVRRPDGSALNSFPSGHTATAFMGAELLRREYWRISPWIGVAGYAVAAGTGFLRMYNNRHWLTDVVGGAGIGILSVEIAYWLYPFITRIFFKGLCGKSLYLAPTSASHACGLTAALTF